MNSASVYTGEDLVRESIFEQIYIDENVAAFFPPGSKLDFALPHGASFWTHTAKIDLILEDGSPQSLFLKIALGDSGRGVVKGEFEAVKALHDIAPNLLPRAIGTGTYKSSADTHFMLSEFIDMIDELPDMNKLCASVAKMHRDSIPRSPNGKFGFHVVTYNGNKSRDVTWCDTWEESFTRLLRRRVEHERAAHGPSAEMDDLLASIYGKVIPKLLRPLGIGPNKIKPVLVHGDFWYGNMGTNISTGEPVLFDAATTWAHNEVDVANMALPRYRMGAAWTREYHKHFPISAPVEDYQDRIQLYQIQGSLCASSLFPNTTVYRELALKWMRELIVKHQEESSTPARL